MSTKRRHHNYYEKTKHQQQQQQQYPHKRRGGPMASPNDELFLSACALLSRFKTTSDELNLNSNSIVYLQRSKLFYEEQCDHHMETIDVVLCSNGTFVPAINITNHFLWTEFNTNVEAYLYPFGFINLPSSPQGYTLRISFIRVVNQFSNFSKVIILSSEQL